jgi:hypothetical protein
MTVSFVLDGQQFTAPTGGPHSPFTPLTGLRHLLEEPDPQESKQVMSAPMKTKQLDLAALQRARDQP